MSGKNPSPGSRSLATLSRKGRGLEGLDSNQLSRKGRGLEGQDSSDQLSRKGRGLSKRKNNQPSPLAGEGVSRRLTGEGAFRFAKQLRGQMTGAESKLWQELRAKRFENYKFRRQVPMGKYIADFVCFERKLIVEVDGSQHDSSAHDRLRDEWFNGQGFRTLRLWNIGALKDMNGALLTILSALEETRS